MNENKISIKIARDLFITQLNWTIIFMGIILVVNIVKLIIAGIQGSDAEGYNNAIFVSSNIYMLVIGIIAIYFLPYFVGNGVPRKSYFAGTVIASIGLSIVIPVVTIIIYFIEKWILNLNNLQYKVQSFNELDLDGNIIGDAIQFMVISPYVDPNENWVLSVVVLSLHIFIFYLLGWFISSSFYRYGVMIGLLSIILTIILKVLKDTLVRIVLDLPAIGWFASLDMLPRNVALASLLFIIIIIFFLIRHTMKHVPIKL